MAIISGLYHVVDQQCNHDQIVSLLRKYKDINKKTQEEVRLSGSKQQVLENLQRVVSLDIVPKDEVYALIQECEENGHQRVYYFLPADNDTRDLCRRATVVADALFGEEWGDDYFPEFSRATESERWADFRTSLPGKPKDWIAKIYGHERIFRMKHRRRTNVTATSYREVLDFEVEDYNTVFVVRWNSAGVLEIRIDQAGIDKSGVAERRLQKVWMMLASALPERQFVPWDLRDAMTEMLSQRSDKEELYDLGTCCVLDAKHGAVEFSPFKDDESIDDEAGRAKAIDELLGHKAKGSHLVISWLADGEAFDSKESLRTVVTGENHNCLVVTSRVSAKVMDYVTNQLRTFAS